MNNKIATYGAVIGTASAPKREGEIKSERERERAQVTLLVNAQHHLDKVIVDLINRLTKVELLLLFRCFFPLRIQI